MNFQNLPLYRCYIDESGDEGLTPASRPFFIVTAVVFLDTLSEDMCTTLDTIKKRVYQSNTPKARDMHWQKLKHPHRMVYIRQIANQPVHVFAVAIWKPKLKYLRDREKLYNTAIKYLIQRTSWFVDDNHGRMKITFSDRSNLRIDKIRTFLGEAIKDPQSQMRPVFDPTKVEVVKTTVQPLLQYPDACAGAVSNAFNPDTYGELHPQFLYEICNRMYRSKQGKLIGYGLKIFPDQEFNISRGKDFKFMEVVEYLIDNENRIPSSSLLPHR
ncbi:MAG: DUF3800 domain-containing protein [Anaerolineae bacterium]|nr:DUF3800 domain-containing protein [Anaerolineae bacterium]